MKSSDAIRRACVTVTPDTTIRHTAEVMESSNVGSVVVADDGGAVGIVTDRDLVRRALAKRVSPEARVDSVMSVPVVTIDAQDDLRSAYRLLHDHSVRRLVVIDGNHPLGVLSVDDLLMNLAGDLETLVRPITGEVLFGHHDAPTPMVSEPQTGRS